jgi:hypothetical protein
VDVIWHDLATPQANPTLPPTGPAGAGGIAYINATNFVALAQLRADDQIFSKSDNVYYGLLLRCVAACAPFAVGDYLVAVRGTMNHQEWLNDAMALMPTPSPQGPGQVGAGFWGIYASMTLNDMKGGTEQSPPAQAIASFVKAAPGKVWLTGHSLGAALATYLAADLQVALDGAVAFDPYFFASPKTGTTDYVNAYQQSVATYSLINYALDLVPMVPPDALGYAALNGGGPSHDVHMIAPLSPGALTPPLPPQAHSPVGYARMLDENNAVAKILPTPPLVPQL